MDKLVIAMYRLRPMRSCMCDAYAEIRESSHLSAYEEYANFEMPKYAEKYAICGFSQNMRERTLLVTKRYMRRSHDRYKPVSLNVLSTSQCKMYVNELNIRC